MTLFHSANEFVPVWYMRQAGRYHSHYQELKKKHSFMELCKNPELARETTLGPLRDFHFNAAILFSDLLFPLEYLSMGLSYESGPPTLQFALQNLDSLKELKPLMGQTAKSFFHFQKEALKLIKPELTNNETLLGFVGGPFTLFAYAVEGSHQGSLTSTKVGLVDGRYEAFLKLLLPALLDEIRVQVEGGADAIAIMDTAVGELDTYDFKDFIVPTLKEIVSTIKKESPQVRLLYYTKRTVREHLLLLRGSGFDVLGVDWRFSLPEIYREFHEEFYIQGNFDPSHLFRPWSEISSSLNRLYSDMKPYRLDRWIMGLGHGVLQHTPEVNVRQSVQYIQHNFRIVK